MMGPINCDKCCTKRSIFSALYIAALICSPVCAGEQIEGCLPFLTNSKEAHVRFLPFAIITLIANFEMRAIMPVMANRSF